MASGIPPIGTRIRKRRQELGLTQKQLADAVGADESSVINWEGDKHFPRRKLGALEAVLGVSFSGEPDDSIEKLEQDVATSRDLTERQKQMLLTLLRRDGQARHRVT